MISEQPQTLGDRLAREVSPLHLEPNDAGRRSLLERDDLFERCGRVAADDPAVGDAIRDAFGGASARRFRAGIYVLLHGLLALLERAGDVFPGIDGGTVRSLLCLGVGGRDDARDADQEAVRRGLPAGCLGRRLISACGCRRNGPGPAGP